MTITTWYEIKGVRLYAEAELDSDEVYVTKVWVKNQLGPNVIEIIDEEVLTKLEERIWDDRDDRQSF